MDNNYVAPLSRLIDSFESLPGIGHKTAQRLSYYMLTLSDYDIENFVESIKEAHEKIKYCSVCCNLTDKELCKICSDETRDKSVICVVESPRDVNAFESTREYNGLYHVLHGLISPVNGITPENIHIKELIARVANDEVKEVIMATNPTVEGEMTSAYISKLIKPFGVKVSRLAYGIPVGGNLEYADEVTIVRALEGRCEM